jgi:hypothetical protein
MAFQVRPFEDRKHARRDVLDVLWLETNVDDRWRRLSPVEENELPKVSIASNQGASIRCRVRQHFPVARLRSENVNGTSDVMTGFGEAICQAASDVRVAKYPQAARALWIAK